MQLGTFGDAFRIAHMTCVALGHSAETCQEAGRRPAVAGPRLVRSRGKTLK